VKDFASVVVLSFHRPADLLHSIGHLHRNTTYPFELIVVDDGSTPAELAVLYDLFKQGSTSSLILNGGNNMGIGTSINRGFSIAKGRYLIKADADIQYHPGWLERGVDILERRSSVGMVGFFKYHHAPCKWDEQIVSDEGDFYIVKDFVSSVFMVTRETYRTYGPFPEHAADFAEDVAFKKRLQEHRLELALTKEDCVYNWGFAPGRSTLYVPGPAGQAPRLRAVHDRPRVFNVDRGER
jgi:GT2 family glycosyltransferase